ncbi:bifunctional aconitate hydratase 2/2-methylisocitrate dehydratase [Candidatus Erwinia haradaeae]|uniref:Aconitate hydratase B n=1 Tax=Candidatus Erwinia haradaeae TaxID=1922217 RepID=A0A803FTM6_9GAMM|nr:bifunctional aconitate hydratase 2/2-methylisocitrate dehydratase [Candidatus Erwinia haradaeae]VFP88147.1 Aconitate hydratase B [Candidatus Erwinia haradaeae]
MLDEYRKHVAMRAANGVVPQALNARQTVAVVELLKSPPKEEEAYLLDLFTNQVPPGVDEAAYIKASFLFSIIKDEAISPLVTPEKAVQLLGTMQGGYNVDALLYALDNNKLASFASKALSHTLLMFDRFYDVEEKAKEGHVYAKHVIQSWADSEWFLRCPEVQEKITVTVFKVTGESNTDDLSPATDAWSRPDIPLHALTMLKYPRPGIRPDKAGHIGPIEQIKVLHNQGFPIAYVGDIIGTGSSRKSAANSLLWLLGEKIPYIPNKKRGGVCLGGKIAPIFFNTMEDAGALPIEVDVSKIHMGDIIDIYPYRGEIRDHITNIILSCFKLKHKDLLNEVRAGGRIPLIIGRALTKKSQKSSCISVRSMIPQNKKPVVKEHGFSLAQKIVGRACGLEGVLPGTYCEPTITSVGSQDTTGPMTRDELKDLACLKFSADLVLQSFCHTAAYPKPIDLITHRSLPNFIIDRGGISLHPGDGIIHSWLNRMLLPDTVGTGGDSHTRFPIGLSFPAGSGLVAFASATGVMPLDMPESVLVNFKGTMQSGITLRDLVHSIPLYAIKSGFLTLEKQNKQNIFSGRILEIQGLSDLKVEQAFEFSDSSAERSSAGCVIDLSQDSIIEYLQSNVILLKWMISEGYRDRQAIERRIYQMEQWLLNPHLLKADSSAEYAAIININLDEIKEPILCAPNDPDNVCLLSEVEDTKIDEVFIGSCMTNISHFRVAAELLKHRRHDLLPTRLWIAPPTKMDEEQLKQEGYYSIFVNSGARMEIPGCSLCMGNQARVSNSSTVLSTSTRNFPNRLGTNAKVFLASAEVSAIASLLGRLPSSIEYQEFMKKITDVSLKNFNYLNFNQLLKHDKKNVKVIFQTKV